VTEASDPLIRLLDTRADAGVINWDRVAFLVLARRLAGRGTVGDMARELGVSRQQITRRIAPILRRVGHWPLPRWGKPKPSRRREP
jgi:hypothetical protein